MEGNRALYIKAIAAIGGATLFAYASPLVVRLTIDSVIGDTPLEAPDWIVSVIGFFGGITVLERNLWIAALAMIALTGLQGIFTYIKGKWAAEASERIAENLRNRLYDHLQRVSAAFHAVTKTGDIIQRCTSDVETVRKFLAVQVVQTGRAIILLVLAIPIMALLDVYMTLVAVAVFPFIITFAILFFYKVKQLFTAVDESEGAMTTVLQENLAGVRVVRAFARQMYEEGKWEHATRDYRDKLYKLIKWLAWYWSLSDILVYAQTGLLLTFGVYWTVTGNLTLGTLVVFITYQEMLLWPVRQMGRLLVDMGKALVAIGRISEILDTPQESRSGIVKRETLRGAIEYRKVNFAYVTDKPVLHDISVRIEPGQTLAIMGPTGAGKSSFVALLPRLYETTGGAITIDGSDIGMYQKTYLRGQIGIVRQEPFLYAATIRENILMGNAAADERAMVNASATAAFHDEVAYFDKGYDTLLGERGVTLSGGQKQRVAIARAILRDPAILALDDSLSAVDAETEAKIQQALRDRRGRATTLIITHKISTAMLADNIMVLEKGRIAQMGTHAELAAQPGFYRRLLLSGSSDAQAYDTEEQVQLSV